MTEGETCQQQRAQNGLPLWLGHPVGGQDTHHNGHAAYARGGGFVSFLNTGRFVHAEAAVQFLGEHQQDGHTQRNAKGDVDADRDGREHRFGLFRLGT